MRRRCEPTGARRLTSQPYFRLSADPWLEPRRTVGHRTVRRVVDLFGCEQHSRLHRGASRGVLDQGNGCGGLVVGKVDDRKGVVFAKLEVEALELASSALHGVGHRIPAIGAAFAAHALLTLNRV